MFSFVLYVKNLLTVALSFEWVLRCVQFFPIHLVSVTIWARLYHILIQSLFSNTKKDYWPHILDMGFGLFGVVSMLDTGMLILLNKSTMF